MDRFAALFLASLAAIAAAQDYEVGGSYIDAPPGVWAPGHGPSGESDTPVPIPPPPPPAPKAKAPLTVQDWPALVKRYVDRHSEGGAWTTRDHGGKTWRLKLDLILEGSILKTDDGLYVGDALFVTAKKPDHSIDIEFTVDLSGDGKVAEYRFRKIDGKSAY